MTAPGVGHSRGAARADVVAALRALSPGGVHLDVDLAGVSRWRIGGTADCIVSPGSIGEVAAVIAFLAGSRIPYVVLGSSTNLLFADDGLRAVGLHLGPRLSALAVAGDRLSCEAGYYVPAFARRVMRAGLAGAEHVCGIPGTLGGLVCMNGGSQRRAVGENIETVTSVDPGGRLVTRSAADCGFAYRRSIFQENGETIVRADFRFPERDDSAAIRARMLAILGERRRKFPLKKPNCGSVFKSDPQIFARFGGPGAVIEKLGLKGMRSGAAEISPLHANFIVNHGGGRAEDVLALIALIARRARESFGCDLATEVLYVRSDGVLLASDAVARQRYPSSEMA